MITLVLLRFLATMCVIRHNTLVAGTLRCLNSWHDHSAPLLKGSWTTCPAKREVYESPCGSRAPAREVISTIRGKQNAEAR